MFTTALSLLGLFCAFAPIGSFPYSKKHKTDSRRDRKGDHRDQYLFHSIMPSFLLDSGLPYYSFSKLSADALLLKVSVTLTPLPLDAM